MEQGIHEIKSNVSGANGNTANSGIYFLRMQAANYYETKKIVAVK
jgi:hypothetical protein